MAKRRSKIQIAKDQQGYQEKPVPHVCANCKYYSSDFVENKGRYGSWTEEKNKRCILGDFAVKKTASCNKFEMKED